MENELIDHIKSELQNLEWRYREGAWEDFSKKNRKKPPFAFWMRFSAAAAIFLFGFFLILSVFYSPVGQKNEIGKVRSIPRVSQDVPLTINDEAKIPPRNTIYSRRVQKLPLENEVRRDSLAPAKMARGIANDTVNFYSAIDMNQINSPLVVSAESIKRKRSNLAKSHFSLTKPFTKMNSWSFGVSLGQGMGQGGATQSGFGTFATYRISFRFQISSGFYFNQLGGIKDLGHTPVVNSTGRFAENVRANLGGLEIPIELKYSVSKKLYTKMGLSVYSIATQEQKILFNDAKTVPVSYVDASGSMVSETIVESHTSLEAVPFDKRNKDKFMGLYNISLGFEQRVIGQKKIFIEPFFKVPLTKYSDYKMGLAQSGIKVGVAF